MAKYELSNEQINLLQTIISNASIQGKIIPMVMELLKALSQPVEG